jgi:hypothetical protein
MRRLDILYWIIKPSTVGAPLEIGAKFGKRISNLPDEEKAD